MIKRMEEAKAPQASVMRKAWFEYVRKTRVKMSKGQKVKATHREAMKHASTGWPVEKAKLARKLAREEKKRKKAAT